MRLSRRRRRAVRLVEELGLRTQRIEQMIRTLEEFQRRIEELRAKIDAITSATRGRSANASPGSANTGNICWPRRRRPTSLRESRA